LLNTVAAREWHLATGSQVVDFALSGAEKFRSLVDLDFAEQVIGRDLDAGVSEQRALLRQLAAAAIAIGFAVRPHLEIIVSIVSTVSVRARRA
jgi:hypothetical protein